jgi:S-adenosylmethionine decarboxylase
LGHHILVSLYGVAFALLDDPSGISLAFDQACEVMGATVLHRFNHQFTPQGVTVVYALAESHISIHTFPEKGSAAMDVYTCGSMNSMHGVEVLLKHFTPKRVEIHEMER